MSPVRCSYPFRLDAEVAAVVPADIEADDLVPGSLYEGNEHRADVAAVAIHQNSHPDISRSSYCFQSALVASGVLTVRR